MNSKLCQISILALAIIFSNTAKAQNFANKSNHFQGGIDALISSEKKYCDMATLSYPNGLSISFGGVKGIVDPYQGSNGGDLRSAVRSKCPTVKVDSLNGGDLEKLFEPVKNSKGEITSLGVKCSCTLSSAPISSPASSGSNSTNVQTVKTSKGCTFVDNGTHWLLSPHNLKIRKKLEGPLSNNPAQIFIPNWDGKGNSKIVTAKEFENYGFLRSGKVFNSAAMISCKPGRAVTLEDLNKIRSCFNIDKTNNPKDFKDFVTIFPQFSNMSHKDDPWGGRPNPSLSVSIWLDDVFKQDAARERTRGSVFNMSTGAKDSASFSDKYSVMCLD